MSEMSPGKMLCLVARRVLCAALLGVRRPQTGGARPGILQYTVRYCTLRSARSGSFWYSSPHRTRVLGSESDHGSTVLLWVQDFCRPQTGTLVPTLWPRIQPSHYGLQVIQSRAKHDMPCGNASLAARPWRSRRGSSRWPLPLIRGSAVPAESHKMNDCCIDQLRYPLPRTFSCNSCGWPIWGTRPIGLDNIRQRLCIECCRGVKGPDIYIFSTPSMPLFVHPAKPLQDLT